MSPWYLLVAAGFISLVGALALLLFRRGEEGNLLVEYHGLKLERVPSAVALALVGVGSIGFSATQLTADAQTGLPQGEVRRVDGIPAFPDVDSIDQDEDRQLLGAWLLGLFDASVRIGMGREDGVTEGALLAVVRRDTLPDEQIEDLDLGALADESAATLLVVRTFDTESVAQLENFAIEAFVTGLEPELAPGDQPFPIGTDHVAFAIPGAEVAAYRGAGDLYDRASADDVSDEIRRERLQTAHRASVEFLASYPDSFFAPDVLFHKAIVAWSLGRIDEAQSDFEVFIRHYPRHPSAPGAADHLVALEQGDEPPPLVDAAPMGSGSSPTPRP